MALIGRLAVDARTQGLRVGERLLADALARIVLVSRQIACIGVIVDAKNDRAVGFYLKYGFALLDPDSGFPRRMFLPMATILESLDDGPWARSPWWLLPVQATPHHQPGHGS